MNEKEHKIFHLKMKIDEYETSIKFLKMQIEELSATNLDNN